MKRLFFSMCICVTALFGCSDDGGQDIANVTEKPKTIVAFLPMTGDLAFLGEPGRRAIKMALDDIKQREKTGAPFSVEIVDTKADPKEAVTRYAETRARYNADIFITTLTGVSEALKPLIARDGGLQIMVAIHPKLMEGTSNAIRFCLNAAQEVRGLTERLAEDKEAVVGLLISKDATSVSEAEDFLIPALKGSGIRYVRQDFSVGQKNFRSILQAFKDGNVTKLVMLGYGSDYPAVLKQLATIDPNGDISVLGGIGFVEFPEWGDANYLNRRIDFIGPSISINGLVEKQTNSIALRYAAKFGAKYMPYDGAFTYDAISALADAFDQGVELPSQVRDEIISWKTYHGVVGDISFLSNGDVTTPMMWAYYEDGKLKGGDMVYAR